MKPATKKALSGLGVYDVHEGEVENAPNLIALYIPNHSSARHTFIVDAIKKTETILMSSFVDFTASVFIIDKGV